MSETHYSPSIVEKKWYEYWLEKKYFESKPDDREPFTIVIPPPNVTGILHMGHMLNATVQDALARKARLQGKNVCWVPGTDHASIATEAKVVKKLKEQGINKHDIGRDAFLVHAFEWKEEYGGIILDQLKLLGASCDWSRTRFTMEPSLYRAVIHVFVDLYKKGEIYRGLRMTNWDPVAMTVLSNEEVIYKDENSKLYFVKYQIADSDEFVTIATVRPETILGDTAIAVNPNDERYQHLIGKKAIVPMVHREIPIIADTYVEMEFGTGCLKVTPAHDPNDYEIGQRHALEIVDVLNLDATMSEAAQFYVGMKASKARLEIVKDLEAQGHLVKVENYKNKVGRSERTNAVVEPKLTKQWFLAMEHFAASALKAVETEEVSFVPKSFFNMYQSWLKADNVRDWCISRQLWWGHRIPAYYYENEVFVAETKEEAAKQATEHFGKTITIEDLSQDEDVLDTWFSSWLWPISVFDGFENPEELNYYYPTSVLVTGWDIIFFWVARMIMAGYEWAPELLQNKGKGIQPFEKVYFTGMVRDIKGRKMSKQLGNSPNALELINKYGADGVRFGMLSSASAGNDIIFDAPIDPQTKMVLDESPKCAQGLHFCNKMWNALRLLQGLPVQESIDSTQFNINEAANFWFDNQFNKLLAELEEKYATYRLSDILMTLYNFIWGDFCSWYLEMIKPAYGQPIDKHTLETAIGIFEKAVVVLHPFMPFVTEELWSRLRERKAGEDCIIAPYPTPKPYRMEVTAGFELLKALIGQIRDLRNQNGVAMKDTVELSILDNDEIRTLLALHTGMKDLLMKIGGLSAVHLVAEEPSNVVSFVNDKLTCFLHIEQKIDVEAERARLQKDLEYYEGFVKICEKKLSNERFVSGAPEAVVAHEKAKHADGLSKIKALKDSLARLVGN